MLFLVDENLPSSICRIFEDLGHQAEYVGDIKRLRQQPDEAIFDYAVKHKAIIVTRDLGFGNPLRFPLGKITGLVIIRFPNEISISKIGEELNRLLKDFQLKDFRNLILVEPGSLRKRALKIPPH